MLRFVVEMGVENGCFIKNNVARLVFGSTKPFSFEGLQFLSTMPNFSHQLYFDYYEDN